MDIGDDDHHHITEHNVVQHSFDRQCGDDETIVMWDRGKTRVSVVSDSLSHTLYALWPIPYPPLRYVPLSTLALSEELFVLESVSPLAG